MKAIKIFSLIIVIIILAGVVITKNTNTNQNEQEAVLAAYNNFYTALNAMFVGDVKQMSEVWSHSDDTIYMGPDDLFISGWAEISKLWQMQAEKKMGGKVSPENMSLVIGKDIAVTYNYEVGENTDATGQVVKVSIRATNIFRKENGQWKMIGHHTDLLPFLAKN